MIHYSSLADDFSFVWGSVDASIPLAEWDHRQALRGLDGHHVAFRFPCDECGGNSCRGHDPELGPELNTEMWFAEFTRNGGSIICHVCKRPVETPQRVRYQHDECMTCKVCGGFPKRGDGASIDCYGCERRQRAAVEAEASRREEEKYEAAQTLLLDGTGTREEREAALEVVRDYCYGVATQW